MGEGNGNPPQYSCLENSLDRGAWWAAVYGVAQSQRQMKRLSTYACIGEGNGNPLQYSCLKNPTDRGARWATVRGVTKSRTWLKRLSSSSSSSRDKKETTKQQVEWRSGWLNPRDGRGKHFDVILEEGKKQKTQIFENCEKFLTSLGYFQSLVSPKIWEPIV